MVNIKSLHSFKFDVCARSVNNVHSLEALFRTDWSEQSLFLGEGSNIAFVEDYPGDIIRFCDDSLEIADDGKHYQIIIGAGYQWHGLVGTLLERGIPGLENLALIPGNVGAAPIQNIGAYGAEFADFCDFVEVFDFHSRSVHRLSARQCQFQYRDSIFKQPENRHLLITKVGLSLNKSWQANVSYKGLDHLPKDCCPIDLYNAVVSLRQSKLPDHHTLGNAGSFFKNPIITATHYTELKGSFPDIPGFLLDDNYVKVPAAWCIDKLGYKGKQRGGIQAYEKQPLVLVNLGHGTGAELLTLAREIKAAVFDKFTIALQNEVTLVGANGRISL